MTSAGKPSRSSEGTVRKRHPVQSDDNSNQSNGTKRLSTSTKEVSGSNHHTAKDELNNIKRNKSINSDTKASVPEQKEDIMIHYDAQNDLSNPFLVKIEFNLIAWALFVVALVMRLWTIDYPRSVVSVFLIAISITFD